VILAWFQTAIVREVFARIAELFQVSRTVPVRHSGAGRLSAEAL
jgi:hypothetical protein